MRHVLGWGAEHKARTHHWSLFARKEEVLIGAAANKNKDMARTHAGNVVRWKMPLLPVWILLPALDEVFDCALGQVQQGDPVLGGEE